VCLTISCFQFQFRHSTINYKLFYYDIFIYLIILYGYIIHTWNSRRAEVTARVIHVWGNISLLVFWLWSRQLQLRNIRSVLDSYAFAKGEQPCSELFLVVPPLPCFHSACLPVVAITAQNPPRNPVTTAEPSNPTASPH
jgi:hypothetical protein